MARTPSRTARVSVARRNLKEVEGKLPTRGRQTAYEASSWWARGRIEPRPDAIRTDSAWMRQVYGAKAKRLTLRGLSVCLVPGPPRGGPMSRQKSAEAWPEIGLGSLRGTAEVPGGMQALAT